MEMQITEPPIIRENKAVTLYPSTLLHLGKTVYPIGREVTRTILLLICIHSFCTFIGTPCLLLFSRKCDFVKLPFTTLLLASLHIHTALRKFDKIQLLLRYVIQMVYDVNNSQSTWQCQTKIDVDLNTTHVTMVHINAPEIVKLITREPKIIDLFIYISHLYKILQFQF